MRLFIHLLFVGWLLFIILLSSCKNEPSPDDDPIIDEQEEQTYDLKKQFRFQVAIGNKTPIVGDTLNLQLSNLNDTLAVDSARFFIDNQWLGTTEGLPVKKMYLTNNQTPGEKVIWARIYTPYGRTFLRHRVELVSDIVPIEQSYRVINEYPHDKQAFTQGLLFHNGYLYEATGLKGASSVRKVNLENGDILQSYTAPRDIFGEGITVHNNRIIQLSWRARKGYVYDLRTFQLLKEFDYPTEGWGLTNIGDNLVMSDGSNVLYFLDANSFQQVGRVEVYNDKGPVDKLNELEYINGEIFANIYMTDFIVRIEPHTGKVLGRIDMKGLLDPADYHREIDVLNGIAWDAAQGRLFVTGKKWPKLYHIEVL